MLNSETTFCLGGLRVLVAEDEYLAADEIATMLDRHGAVVVGPVSTVNDAHRLASSAILDGAVLDVHLRGAMVWPVAEVIMRRHIRFAFVSGYDAACCPQLYAR